jgi:large subunit ribosomal protein L10
MNQTILDSKIELVSEIAGKFQGALSSVVVEYRGLTVAQVTQLRRLLRAEGIEFKVYKNSMVQRAVEDVGYGALTASLTGPNAIAFGSDAVAPSRILAKFAKKNKMLVVKGGVVEGKVVDADTIKILADLPGREGMIAMLLGCLQSPIRDFAYAIKQIAEKQEVAQQ